MVKPTMSTAILAGVNPVYIVSLTMALATWHSLLGLFLRLSLALLGKNIKAILCALSSMNQLTNCITSGEAMLDNLYTISFLQPFSKFPA